VVPEARRTAGIGVTLVKSSPNHEKGRMKAVRNDPAVTARSWASAGPRHGRGRGARTWA